jgi:hypothetical protein
VKKRIKKIALIASAFMFVGQSLAAADPAYYPEGPQTNVAVSTISSGGWTKCYEENYGTTILTLANLQSQCSGDYVLYAGGETADPNNYLLLATGARSVVWAGTNVTQNTLTTLSNGQLSNGSYWYAQDALSLGFSPDPVVKLHQADICATQVCAGEADDGSLRLSWHGNGVGQGGWNIGNAISFQNNGVTNYLKAIWVSNGARPYLPLVQTSPVSMTMDKNIMGCTVGTYKIGMSEVAISSVKYQLYVNNQLMSSAVYDKGSNIPDTLKSVTANKVSALVSAKDAYFDLSGMSSYSAYCVVEAFGYGSSAASMSDTYQDAAFIAAAAAKDLAWEAQRSAATAANFTKEAREMRKRIAARSGN